MKNLILYTLLLLALITLAVAIESCNNMETINPDKESISQSIGSDGGIVSLDNDEATLEIPAESLSDTTIDISITRTSSNGKNLISSYVYELEPSGTQFAQPITLTIKYDPELLTEDMDLEYLFVTKMLEDGKYELYATQVDEINHTLTAEIRSFSPWGATFDNTACLNSDCGTEWQLTTTYNANRTITLNWNYNLGNSGFNFEIQRAVVQDRFIAFDEDFSRLSVLPASAREYTDGNIGPEGAFYFYRIRTINGNTLAPFSEIKRETVFGEGDLGCNEFNISSISKTVSSNEQVEVNVDINRSTNFDKNINLTLLQEDGSAPSQDFFSNFSFSESNGNATLLFTMGNVSPGTYTFIIRGFTTDGAACEGTLTLTIEGNSSTNSSVFSLAGSTNQGFIDGPSNQASFSTPFGADTYNGFVYVADMNNHAIRKIDENGNVTTLAGNGSSGYQDGNQAQFFSPYEIAIDTTTQYAYVSDNANLRIRRINLNTGSTITYAGKGIPGSDDGAASEATFFGPTGLAIKGDSLFIGDYQNNLIRVVNLVEDPADAIVSTFAGNGQAGTQDGPNLQAAFNRPVGLAYSNITDRLYVVDNFTSRIRSISETTTTTLELDIPVDQALSLPYDVTVDQDGNLFVAEGKNVIRKLILQPDGTFTNELFAGVYESSGFQNGPLDEALFNLPTGLCIAPIMTQGSQLVSSLIICDAQNHTIRYIPLE